MRAKFEVQAGLERKLARVLDEAIELADVADQVAPAAAIAERVFKSEPDIMAEVWPAWAVERLTWMISRRRREKRQESRPQQMVLDPVFKGLPQRIFLRDGTRAFLARATVTETREHLAMLRKRFRSHSRVRQFEAVVELHEKWAAIQKGISWEEAVRREAEERESS